MTTPVAIVLFIVVVALIFDFANGWHDAANSIATVVSTRVLSPGIAVLWAAFFNFVAFAVYGTRVAKTIGGDLVNIKLLTAADMPNMPLYVLLAGLMGAIILNIITWWLGLPTSNSHALVGGYAGAAMAAHRGLGGGLLIPSGWTKTTIFIVASPLIGMVLGFIFMLTVFWIFRRSSPSSVDKAFRRGQLFSAAAFSLGHGGNDAQKTMGIITLALMSGGLIAAGPGGKLPDIPLWVVLIAHAAIGLGTLSGGWRIVHTMGSKITKLKPVGGFCAETAGAATLFGATLTGIPVSTTHTITGAIVGVGATRRLSAVKWGVAGRIGFGWILTIPVAGIIAALSYLVIEFIYHMST